MRDQTQNLFSRDMVPFLISCHIYMYILQWSPEREITKVRVIFRLSVRPLMGTEVEPLAAIVDLPTET